MINTDKEEREKMSNEAIEKTAWECACKEIDIEKMIQAFADLGIQIANSKVGKLYVKNLEYLNKIYKKEDK